METYLYQDLYDLEDQHWWHQAKRSVVIEALRRYLPHTKRSQNKHKLLDVGCGTGKNVEAFQAFADSHGVDVSEDALAFCRARGLTQVRVAAAEDLPFTDHYFDVVTLLDVLEHIDEQSALREVTRVLKPGGLLIITVPALQWLWSEWDVVLHHRQRYTAAQLRSAVSPHSYTVLKVSYLYSFLVLPVWLIRRVKSLFTKRVDHYQSDFKLSSPWLNQLMTRLASLERSVFWRRNVPVGTSVVGVFRKK